MREYWILLTLCNIARCIRGTEDALMSHFDLTSDGTVDARELRTVAYSDDKTAPQVSMEILHRADTDMDEILSASELRTAKKLLDAEAQRKAEQWLQDHDTDRDGKMSEAELLQGEYVEHGHAFSQIRDRFREADTDNDGLLSVLELMHVRRLLRAVAVKDAAEIMKKYDSDKDHFVSLREAEILADEVFDLGPSVASAILNCVDHKKEQKINELELVDFLSDLRAEAAVAALDKLAALDKNGNGMITFDEIVAKYGRQTQKAVLKKIFSEVDINKNANIDPIEFISLQNLVSAWNREVAAAKEGEKKKRVITVTMPRSPELETLLQARRQRADKAQYQASTYEKRYKRQADNSITDEQTFIDANGNPVHTVIDDSDYKVLTVRDKNGKVLSSQKTADLSKFENFIDKMTAMIHRFADLGNTLKNSTLLADKNVTDGINEFTRIQEKLSSKSVFKENLKLAGLPFGALTSAEQPKESTANPGTTPGTPTTTTKSTPTTTTRAPTTATTTSPSAGGVVARVSRDEDKYSIATVRDEKGAVVSNQFIADFNKFQRFMEQMQKDIHRIAQMADANVTVNDSIDPAPQTLPGGVPRQEHAPQRMTNDLGEKVHSDVPGASQYTEINAVSKPNEVASGTPIVTTASPQPAPAPTPPARKVDSDPLGALKDLLDPLHVFNPDRASVHPVIPGASGYSVISATSNFKEDIFGTPVLESVDAAPTRVVDGAVFDPNQYKYDPLRMTNEKGVKVHSSVADSSDYKVIPSTRHFKMDTFGNPILEKDDNGNYIVEDTGNEVLPPQRVTNEKGEVVHSHLLTDDYKILNVTEHKGRRQDVPGSEEDDFYSEQTSSKLSDSTGRGDNGTKEIHTESTNDITNASNGTTNGTKSIDAEIKDTTKAEDLDGKEGKEDNTKKNDQKGGKKKHKKKHGKHRKHKHHKEHEAAKSQKSESGKVTEALNATTSGAGINGTNGTNSKGQASSDLDGKKTIESEKPNEVGEEKKDETTEGKGKPTEQKSEDHHTDETIAALLSSDNATALTDDLDLNGTSSDPQNDSKRLKDEPLNDVARDDSLSLQYLTDDGAETETNPHVPSFDVWDDGMITEEAGVFRGRKNRRRQGAIAGGRPVGHRFEETLAETVSYNDPDFS